MPESNQKLKAAVIGTGFIGPVHVEALRRIGVDVAGVLGSSEERSLKAAHRMGLRKGYASLEELLADTDVDVVHVTSPNRHHFEQTSLCVKAGKHVVCEKPLAMTSAESEKLVQIASDSGKVTAVNYNIRYYPLCLEAADRFRQGLIGDLFHVSGSYFQDWLFHPTDFNWRVMAEDGGPLRAVADIGTHWLDLIQFITNQKVVAVCSDLQTVHTHRTRPWGDYQTFTNESSSADAQTVNVTTEDAGSILLRFESGGRGAVSVSQVMAGRRNRLQFELAGSKQALSWDSERPNEMWIGQRESANHALLKDAMLSGTLAAQHTDYPGGHNEGFPDTFKQLFKDVYGYIANGDFSVKPVFPTFFDGHREVVLCEAILRSHSSGQWVSVDC